MIESKLTKLIPLIVIVWGVGIVGFVLSLGWGKTSGKEMDRDTVIFLAKVWSGIALFGTIVGFIV